MQIVRRRPAGMRLTRIFPSSGIETFGRLAVAKHILLPLHAWSAFQQEEKSAEGTPFGAHPLMLP
jgi:hypothetical protein